MANITFIEASGQETTINLPDGWSLMQGATANGVDGIVGECGGSCACATCHCYVDEARLGDLPPPSEGELDMLENVACERRPNSRLACQIKATAALEGLIVRDSGTSLKDQNAGIYIYPGAHRAVVRKNDLTYNLFGLWIEKANDVRVEHNTITGLRDVNSSQRGNGVQLYNTTGARIEGNHISFVRDALYVDVSHHAIFRGNKLHHSRYGTHYMNSYYNLWEDNDTYLNRGGLALMEVRDQVVRNNRAWGNSDHGIMLRTLQDSIIENNVVADNARGFFIYDVEYATLRGNLILRNTVGVHLSAGSTRNKVEGNDFIGNREQVRYVGARDERWGTDSGNYWSNYLGWDRDGNGVGDVPYEANDMVDRLTWRHPTIKLLLASPAVQALRLVGQQFPVLRVPTVVDPKPRMQPNQPQRNFQRDTQTSPH